MRLIMALISVTTGDRWVGMALDGPDGVRLYLAVAMEVRLGRVHHRNLPLQDLMELATQTPAVTRPRPPGRGSVSWAVPEAGTIARGKVFGINLPYLHW